MSPATAAALASGGVVLRYLLWVAGWDVDGDPATWGLWDGEDDVTVTVVGGLTGANISRDYVGATLGKVPQIVHGVGLESRSVDFEVSQINSRVKDMVYGGTIRGARVELHRAIFSPATWALVDEPEPIFIGRLDTAEPTIAAAGDEGSIVLSCSSDPVELTRSNPALKSNETLQALQPGDDFRQYDTAGMIDVRWGQAKGKVKK